MQIFIWFSENSKFSFFSLVLIPQIKRFQLYHWVVCLRLFSCWRNKRDYCIPDIRVKIDSAFNINLSLSLSLSLCVCLQKVVHIPVAARDQPQVLSVAFCFVFWGSVLTLSLELAIYLGWLASESAGVCLPWLPSTEVSAYSHVWPAFYSLSYSIATQKSFLKSFLQPVHLFLFITSYVLEENKMV